MIRVRGGKGLTNEDFMKEELEEEPKWFRKLSKKLYEIPYLDLHNSSCTWGEPLYEEDEAEIVLALIVDNDKEFTKVALMARRICKKNCVTITEEEADMVLSKWKIMVKLDRLSYFAKHGYGRRRKRGQVKSSHKKR